MDPTQKKEQLFHVTCGKRKKLLKISPLTDKSMASELITECKLLFDLTCESVTIQAYIEQFQDWIEIDETCCHTTFVDVKKLQVIIDEVDLTCQSPQSSSYCTSAASAFSSGNTSPDPDSSAPLPSFSFSSPPALTKCKQKVDIPSILKSHTKGDEVLNEYETTSRLTPSARQKMVNIIVADMVEKHGYYPPESVKKDYAKSIIEQLPNLKDQESKTGHEHYYCFGGNGYIQTKLKNIRRNLDTSDKKNNRAGHKRSLTSSSTSTVTRENSVEDVITVERAREMEAACRNLDCTIDKDIITDYMSKTFHLRRKWIAEDVPSVTDILEKFPRFLDTDGLVDLEFKLMYGEDKANSLIGKWETISAAINRLANIPPAECTPLQSLQGLINQLPSYAGRKKISPVEVMKQLIDRQPSGTNISHYIKVEKGDRKQPYLLEMVGDYYVIVDSLAFPIGKKSSLPRAIDYLFKIHYIFNLEYSAQNRHLFEFLQFAVYQLDSISGDISPRVRELAVSINRLKDQAAELVK